MDKFIGFVVSLFIFGFIAYWTIELIANVLFIFGVALFYASWIIVPVWAYWLLWERAWPLRIRAGVLKRFIRVTLRNGDFTAVFSDDLERRLRRRNPRELVISLLLLAWSLSFGVIAVDIVEISVDTLISSAGFIDKVSALGDIVLVLLTLLFAGIGVLSLPPRSRSVELAVSAGMDWLDRVKRTLSDFSVLVPCYQEVAKWSHQLDIPPPLTHEHLRKKLQKQLAVLGGNPSKKMLLFDRESDQAYRLYQDLEACAATQEALFRALRENARLSEEQCRMRLSEGRHFLVHHNWKGFRDWARQSLPPVTASSSLDFDFHDALDNVAAVAHSRGTRRSPQRPWNPGIKWLGTGIALLSLGILVPSLVSWLDDQETVRSMSPLRDWRYDDDGCLHPLIPDQDTNKFHQHRLDMAIKALSQRVLKKSSPCVTFPYLGYPDKEPRMGNKFHAGIDFRTEGEPVYAAEAGRVVHVRFDPSIPRGEGAADRRQGSRATLNNALEDHSTLIIENYGRTRKILYLNMDEIWVKKGTWIRRGQQLGISGSVGTDAPHLHLEVWPSRSPQYCDRFQPITATACIEHGTPCGLNDIRELTVSPTDIILFPDRTPAPFRTASAIPRRSKLTFRGLGPVRIGMTVREAQRVLRDRLLGLDEGKPECHLVRPQLGPCGVTMMVVDNKIVRIDIENTRQLFTETGIAIGYSENRVLKAYSGRFVMEPHKYVNNGHYIKIRSPAGGTSMVFETDGVRVTAFRVGRSPEVDLVEKCF